MNDQIVPRKSKHHAKSRTKTLAADKLDEVLNLIGKGVPIERLAKKFNVSKAYMANVKVLGKIPQPHSNALTEHGVALEKSLAASTKHHNANRNKKNARSRLQYAVEVGEMVRPTVCPACGLEKFVEGHHEDYSKPLEVIWMCSKCHGKHHAGLLTKNSLNKARKYSQEQV